MAHIEVCFGLKALRCRVASLLVNGSCGVGGVGACHIGVLEVCVVHIRVHRNVLELQHGAALVGLGGCRLRQQSDHGTSGVEYAAGRNDTSRSELTVSSPVRLEDVMCARRWQPCSVPAMVTDISGSGREASGYAIRSYRRAAEQADGLSVIGELLQVLVESRVLESTRDVQLSGRVEAVLAIRIVGIGPELLVEVGECIVGALEGGRRSLEAIGRSPLIP